VKQIGRTRREANIVYSSARLSCLCQPEEKTNREDEEVRSCMTFTLHFTKNWRFFHWRKRQINHTDTGIVLRINWIRSL
jgi:hypothetical protein